MSNDFDTVRHFIEGSAPFWTPQSHGAALAALDRLQAENERLHRIEEAARKYLDDVEMWEGAADPEPLRTALEEER